MERHVEAFLGFLVVTGSLSTAACSNSSSGAHQKDASLGSKDAASDVASSAKDASRKDAALKGSGPDAHAEAGSSKGPPPEVVANAKDWPMANRNYQATRATFDATINKSNVSKLTKAWSFTIP